MLQDGGRPKMVDKIFLQFMRYEHQMEDEQISDNKWHCNNVALTEMHRLRHTKNYKIKQQAKHF